MDTSDSFIRIAITYPEIFVGESREIVRLLDGEIDRVHIRKPGVGISQLAALLDTIPACYRHRISLHEHFCLAEPYGLGGVHLNSRNPQAPPGWDKPVSRSLHSLDEIGASYYDYAFLSPIYPSISKPGYRPTWSEENLRKSVDRRIIALGGVTPDKHDSVKALGFGGAAMLGALWNKMDFRSRFSLQFITHPSGNYSFAREAEMALRGGCRWVQIRHKEASFTQLTDDILAIKPLCRKHGAIVILDDHAELVNRYDLDGVHLGKADMPVREARRLIGPRKIIGATANTFSDIEDAASQGADYIGLGPFRFTTTKAGLSPVLGIEGYRRIMSECRSQGINLPVVAIGGITQADIPDIMHTGVTGIALSSTILTSPDPETKTRTIINTIKKCQN